MSDETIPADHHEPARGDAVPVDDGAVSFANLAASYQAACNAIASIATALGMDPGALPGAVVERVEMLRTELGHGGGTLRRKLSESAADLASCEYDLARLIERCRSDGYSYSGIKKLCDEIEGNGVEGWLRLAIDRDAGPERKERAAWQGRIDALDAELRQYEDGAAEVRSALGARDDETTLDAARRVASERDALRSEVERLTRERGEAVARRDRAEHAAQQTCPVCRERGDEADAAEQIAVALGLEPEGTYGFEMLAAVKRLTERLGYYERGHYDGLLADLRKRLGMDAAGRPLASEETR